MFITLEGPEGCGKSTQAQLLRDYLVGLGKKVLLTIEPGGTKLGQEIRTMLLQPGGKLETMAEILLFAADRAQHVAEIIRPALAAGQIVISDRYIDSTIAYQLGGRRIAEDQVRYLNMVSSGGLLPDLTILLDVSPQVGLARAKKVHQVDRFELEKVQFHERVREKYLELAANEPERIKVINADKLGIPEVQAEIQKIVLRKIGT